VRRNKDRANPASTGSAAVWLADLEIGAGLYYQLVKKACGAARN